MSNINTCNPFITNIHEIINKEYLINILKERKLTIYWGTAPTGKIHLGYLIPLAKIIEFLEDGHDVIILIADNHAILDATKSNENLLQYRIQYYREMIITILQTINPYCLDKLKFVNGTDIQYLDEYLNDFIKLSTKTSIRNAQKASSEVVKSNKNPMLSDLIYPVFQALDAKYLKADIQLGGIDQRKIMTYTIDHFDKNSIHIMTKMMPSLSNKCDKMSSSDNNSKIDLLDDFTKIIKKAFCEDGNIIDNKVLVIIELLFPLIIKKYGTFKINENINYDNFDILKNDFAEKKITSIDIKTALNEFLINFLEPIRNKFLEKDMLELIKNAYL